MSSQPTPAEEKSGISTAAAVYLIVTTAAVAGLAGIIAADMLTPLEPFQGAPALLAVVAAVAAIGAIVRCALDTVNRRIDGLERRLTSVDTDSIAAAERINLRLVNGKS